MQLCLDPMNALKDYDKKNPFIYLFSAGILARTLCSLSGPSCTGLCWVSVTPLSSSLDPTY